ncbi:leucine-rich repeat protein [bacterium]|nr:leucine-rich repeat protein [bacterium]
MEDIFSTNNMPEDPDNKDYSDFKQMMDLIHHELAMGDRIGYKSHRNNLLFDMPHFDDATTIDASLIAGCKSLESIILDSRITGIKHDTFANCANLKYVVLPNNLLCIDINAFRNCKNIIKIVINNLTFDSREAFYAGAFKLGIAVVKEVA